MQIFRSKMRKSIKETSKEKAANIIVKRLIESGHEAYWVGGCVRNRLLNLPAEDIDITTSATPETVAKLFRRTVKVGIKFGVVVVMLKGVKTEVATFRSDGEYLDCRHPSSVHFSTAREDAKRRDFTINGLFFDPIKNKVIDYVGGKKDLKKGIIRGIGDPAKRIREDALRMLRAVRFAIKFNFKIEPKTFAAIKKNARLISKISADRIRIELEKTFCGERAGDALKLLYDTGLLQIILPEAARMKGVKQPPEFHPEGDVFEHTVIALNLLNKPSVTLAMATLLHDIGKPPTMKIADRIRFNLHNKVGADIALDICRRLNFPQKQQEKIVSLVERHMDFFNIKEMRQAKLKRFLAAETIAEDLKLHKADCLASHGDISNISFCKNKIKEFKKSNELNPNPLVNGHDLIALGFKPGPLFSKILTTVRDAQLEKTVCNKEEALRFIKNNFKEN